MTATHVTVRITVDPAGRVLVHECERTLPSDKVAVDNFETDQSGCWQRAKGCVTYFVSVTLPTPELESPECHIVTGFGGKVVRDPE